MEPWFGVIAGGTETATKKESYLAILTHTRKHQDGTYKNKRKKEIKQGVRCI